MKAVHFGAGNIGRGFIGAVLHDNNYEITFVDVQQEIIDQMNQTNAYTIELIDEAQTQLEITNVAGINSRTDEAAVIAAIGAADLITTSVGANNLGRIAELLAQGLLKRAQQHRVVDVIANENAINASDMLKKEIEQVVTPADMQIIDTYTGFVNSAIDRQALAKEVDGKMIPLVEPYFEWVINNSERKNTDLPQLTGVTYVEELQPYIERKLYLVNAEHAVSAYMGQFLGRATVQEALVDPQIYRFVENLMKENAAYLLAEYQMDREELAAFIQKTLGRHSSPLVKDDVKRVGRAPLRKLGRNERIIAPLKKLYDRGLPTTFGERAVAIVLQYNDPEDAEAQELDNTIEAHGIKATLRKYSELEDEPLLERIEAISKKIEQDKTFLFREE